MKPNENTKRPWGFIAPRPFTLFIPFFHSNGEQRMIFPLTVYFQITLGEALSSEAGLFQNPDGSFVPWHNACLNAMMT
jgi:hypothetical protein